MQKAFAKCAYIHGVMTWSTGVEHTAFTLASARRACRHNKLMHSKQLNDWNWKRLMSALAWNKLRNFSLRKSNISNMSSSYTVLLKAAGQGCFHLSQKLFLGQNHSWNSYHSNLSNLSPLPLLPRNMPVKETSFNAFVPQKNDLNEIKLASKSACGAAICGKWMEWIGMDECRVILLPPSCSWDDQLYTKIVDLRILSWKKTTRRAADMLFSNQKFANETLEGVQTTTNM